MTCCSAPRPIHSPEASGEASPRPVTGSSPADPGDHRIAQVPVPGGSFRMGDHHGDAAAADGEGPVHEVSVAAFDMDATTVTNDDFARFVDATGYRTEAEEFGYSAVFHLALRAPESDILGQPPHTPWWLGVRGADWRHPQGRWSDLRGLETHPVVHVSWNDAHAYCRWAGRALPTEARWERAARGGQEGLRFPWGDDLAETDGWPCNIWQGDFPASNDLDDGYLTTAPVRSYAPNGFGLWQTVGNVWEWCSDWYDPTYYRRAPAVDPTGPDTGTARSLRGGSFLCHDSYCNRYRVAARSSNTPDSSAANIGFRTCTRQP
ncbi:formylglycine-generating enzyme family protein [Pseudonocardia ailaonensis]|uniref:Formylglycine-generating enzyme family protein n=1 Tax=Pseudonocardia ailaonensis TaxID=367279 RepID=A0ABN2MI57_9PSEU